MDPIFSCIKKWCKKRFLSLENENLIFKHISTEKCKQKTRVYIEEKSNTETTYGKWMAKVEPYMEKHPLLKEACIYLADKHGNSLVPFRVCIVYVNGCLWSIDEPPPQIDKTKQIEIAICMSYFCIWVHQILGWIDKIFDTNLSITDKEYELLYLEYVIEPCKQGA